MRWKDPLIFRPPLQRELAEIIQQLPLLEPIRSYPNADLVNGCEMVAVLKSPEDDKPFVFRDLESALSRARRNPKKKDFRFSSKAPFLLVGTAGFEPTASRTPSRNGTFA